MGLALSEPGGYNRETWAGLEEMYIGLIVAYFVGSNGRAYRQDR
jgi:hypothetical protein